MRTIRLAIVGDTQRVLPVERLAFLRETNDAGRCRIAQAILADQLDGIVHLGDVVGSASDWGRFDQVYLPSELSNKQFHVCRGNHDCGGFWFGSPHEFNQRFPKAVAGLQVVDLGLLRLFCLDTNKQSMSEEQWNMQLAQFQGALAEASSDAHVKHVIAAGHHPPFTNARWHQPSRAVFSSFVRPFLECPKTRAFFAGHVHGYERFTIEGRSFVVSGGGGGARFSHLHGDKRRLPGAIDPADPNPLHFVLVETSQDAVNCTVRAIDEPGGEWVDLDRFNMR
jgi:acid phosphatase type 7